jgi:uncharacterized membrane protein
MELARLCDGNGAGILVIEMRCGGSRLGRIRCDSVRAITSVRASNLVRIPFHCFQSRISRRILKMPTLHGTSSLEAPRGAAPPDFVEWQLLCRETTPHLAGGFRDHEEYAATRALGWLSASVGLARIAFPGAVGRCMGTNDGPGLMQAFGVCDLAVGLGLLTSRSPAPWLWCRVANDIVDLTYLANSFGSAKSDKPRVLASALAVAGMTAIDAAGAASVGSRPARQFERDERGIRIHATITINANADDLYRFWRNFENLPHVLGHLKSVATLGDGRTHWVADAPAGRTAEWIAETTEDVPSRRIAWKSAADADVVHSGSVEFRPTGGKRGTVLDVDMRYDPPGGALGAAFAFLFGKEPGQQVREDLRRYKAFVETGEVPTTRGQSSARRGETCGG